LLHLKEKTNLCEKVFTAEKISPASCLYITNMTGV